MGPPTAGRKDPPENPGEVTIWPYPEVYSNPPGLECGSKRDEPSVWRCLAVHREHDVRLARGAVAHGALELAS